MEDHRAILFADVCDSTGMTEAMGDTAAHSEIADVLGLLSRLTRRSGGKVIKTIGDEIMSAFPSAHAGVLAAMDMQQAVTGRPPVHGIRTSVRIGLHAGPVIVEDGDLFGDAVNVAARVAGLAAADQILTTGDTIDRVPDADMGDRYRNLGVHGLRGRDERLQLVEVIWRDEGTQLTIVAPRLEQTAMRELIVTLGDQVCSLSTDSSDVLLLGRGTDCTLVVPSSSASRAHADIRSRGRLFYLEDHSTNGTYVRPSNGNEMFVHRNQILLQGSGVIRLGESSSSEGPFDIEYRTRSRPPE